MSPLPRRMLGRAASWENPQVHPSPPPEELTYVVAAVAIRLFVGFPHQIFNSPSGLIDKRCKGDDNQQRDEYSQQFSFQWRPAEIG